MKKINVKSYTDQQSANSYLEGFLEGRDCTVDELLRMHKSGMKPREIIKFLKDYQKKYANHNKSN